MNDDLLGRLRSLVQPGLGGPTRAGLFVRIATGYVFVTSGALKFLFDNQGPGRFSRIGLSPQLAFFVGAVEIVAGLLLALGLFTRLAVVPLLIDMLVAIATTKLPLLSGAGPEPVSAMPKTGLLAFAYQARLDVTMLCVCAYFLSVGAGAVSLDAWRARRRSEGLLMGSARAQAG